MWYLISGGKALGIDKHYVAFSMEWSDHCKAYFFRQDLDALNSTRVL
jgi:hypothetical protein